VIDPQAVVSSERSSTDRRAAWRARSRWLVHLGLLGSAAAALVTLQLLHVRVAYHTVVGLVFVGLLAVHLVQRRRTIARMATQLVRTRTLFERKTRSALSDLLLFFITLNVLASGIVDWYRGQPTQLPFPMPFDRWHLDAGLVLVIYLGVHVWRRRKRLWRSTIR
jgi:FtsH-binding integral membrane protein